MRPYNPYANYMTGYNPCMEAAGYSAYNLPGAGSGEAVTPMPMPMPMPLPNMPNMMPGYSGTLPNIPNTMPGMPATPYLPGAPGMTPGMPPMPGIAMCPEGSAPYTVQEGDTLYNIARMYGTTVADILAANPSITETSMLFIGQIVCVPAPAVKPRPCACPTGSMTYTVAQGDTLTSIADRFSLSVYSLAVANPGFQSESLAPGMRLCIAPFACQPGCVESERYTIAAGEDLMKLADKFQVSTDDLLKANPFSPPCYFVAGNAICLPSNATMPPAAQHSRH